MSKMQYNVCSCCGAKDGRAGMLIGTIGQDESYCLNCDDTMKTGDITIHTNLIRTPDEIQKTMDIINDK